MYDDFLWEHKCRTENCPNFAEYSLFENSHGNYVWDVCVKCEEKAGDCVTGSRIERGLSEWWEIAEQMGWINPIDILFDEHGVDNPEDLPEHLQAGYPDAVDEAEGEAIDFIFKNFSDYITVKVTVRFGWGADKDSHVETFKFFSDAEADAFKQGLSAAVGRQSYEIGSPAIRRE